MAAAGQVKNDLMRIAAWETTNMKLYSKPGNKIFDFVSKLIKSKTTYKISRQAIGGSMGKKTSLGYDQEPDFDVILFVRDQVPPLQAVVDEFHQILSTHLPAQHDDWTFNKKDIRKNAFCVMFSMITNIQTPNGPKRVRISFDLLPAIDFSTNIDHQAELVLARIKASPNPETAWQAYSTSFCEKTVQFVNKQSDFVHLVIRLAKLWDRALRAKMKKDNQNYYITGRSSIIELTAIQAGNECSGNILESFRRFLELMKGIQKIHVNLFDSKVRPRPIILDCVNPYNNYAKAISPKNQEYFKTWATSTSLALEQLQVENGKEYASKLVELKKFFGQ